MREAFAFADEVEEAVGQALGKAERLPRAILEQAMRGDLVPTEAELARLDGIEYEPAAILLDRVRADLRRRVDGRSGSRGAGSAASPRRRCWRSSGASPGAASSARRRSWSTPWPSASRRSRTRSRDAGQAPRARGDRRRAPHPGAARGTAWWPPRPRSAAMTASFSSSVLGQAMRGGSATTASSSAGPWRPGSATTRSPRPCSTGSTRSARRRSAAVSSPSRETATASSTRRRDQNTIRR